MSDNPKASEGRKRPVWIRGVVLPDNTVIAQASAICGVFAAHDRDAVPVSMPVGTVAELN